jgi:acyl-lipid omega-6 desaturase (Delta-12 desaturase)
MAHDPNPSPTTLPPVKWQSLVKKYQAPSLPKSLWQIANTVIPYVGLWGLMYFTVRFSWPLTLGLAALAALFLVRVFIIFHDCGHGSYFKFKRLNHVVGFVSGLLTLTPYRRWKWQHAVQYKLIGEAEAIGTTRHRPWRGVPFTNCRAC